MCSALYHGVQTTSWSCRWNFDSLVICPMIAKTHHISSSLMCLESSVIVFVCVCVCVCVCVFIGWHG